MVNKIFSIVLIISASFLSIDLAIIGGLVYYGLRGDSE